MKIGLSVVFTALWYFLSEFLMMPAFALDASVGIYFNLLIYLVVMAFIWADYENEKIGGISWSLGGIAIFIFVGIIMCTVPLSLHVNLVS